MKNILGFDALILILISTLLTSIFGLMAIPSNVNPLIVYPSPLNSSVAASSALLKISPNILLAIVVKVLQWHRFTILYRNNAEKRLLKLWVRNPTFNSLLKFYQVKVEVAEVGELPYLCSLVKTNGEGGSCKKENFVCSLNPEEISHFASENPSLTLHSWLIITSSNLSQWEVGLTNLSLNLNSEIFLASSQMSFHSASNQYSYKVYEAYKIHQTYPLRILEFCSVLLNEGLIGSNCLEEKYQRRRNLGQFPLRVIGLDIAQYMVNVSQGIDGNFVIQGGLLAELFLSIAQEINASFSLTILPGYGYGSFKNMSWTGMIGFLSRNDVDFSITEISMVSDRLDYIDYTNSFMTIARRIYIKRIVEEGRVNWLFFSNPFSPFLHLSVGLCTIGLIITLWISNATHQSQSVRDELSSLYEVTWLVICAICQKGAHLMPKRRSSKVIFAIIYLTFLIIFTGYCATLTSQLTFAPPLQLPFKDLGGLLETKGWSGGTVKGDLTQIYMEKTCPEILAMSPNEPNVACKLYIKLWEKVISAKANELPINFQEGLVQVLKGRFAFVASSLGTRNEINTKLPPERVCDIHELDGDHVASNVAFGLRRNFPFKRLINYKLLQLQESGIMKRLKDTWLPKLNQDCETREENFVQISIKDIGVAPLFVFFSIISSCLILTLELLLNIRRKRKFGEELTNDISNQRMSPFETQSRVLY